jgi:L-alanine-DL-glutamate epimerase-like enolase superfamily enzyme
MKHPAAPLVRLVRIDLFERPVTLRLPFRFGAATVTHCTQAFVRVEADVNGRRHTGATAELMPPKWFDKSPELTHEQNAEQLREALRSARQSYLDARTALSAWQLSQQQGDAAIAAGVARGLPRLAAQFGPAQLDKAVADAVLRATALSFVDGLRAGVLGDPWSSRLALSRPQQVLLRHTVGLLDRLVPSEPGSDPADGLPATLQDAIGRHGLTHFKLKLAGQADADIDRLVRIATVLESQADDWRVTLDGNESFSSAAALGEFWTRLRATPALKGLLGRTLLLEQPLPRRIALAEPISALSIAVPVILDESDDADDVFERGLALGYRGISSKACKGLYRSLHSAALVARDPARRLLSGEDLTCQAGLAVQQDTLLAATLGAAHIERNGHHYVDGFGSAPAHEAAAFATAHPGFYASAGGRPRLAISRGRLDLRSLHTPGFATAAQPDWSTLQPIT